MVLKSWKLFLLINTLEDKSKGLGHAHEGHGSFVAIEIAQLKPAPSSVVAHDEDLSATKLVTLKGQRVVPTFHSGPAACWPPQRATAKVRRDGTPALAINP